MASATYDVQKTKEIPLSEAGSVVRNEMANISFGLNLLPSRDQQNEEINTVCPFYGK